MTAAVKHYLWIALLAVAFSFPVGAVFEGAIKVPVSLYVAPALVTLPIVALACLLCMPEGERRALLLIFAATTIANLIALPFIGSSSAMPKMAMYWATLVMFGMVTACVLQDRKLLPVFGPVMVALGVVSLAMLILHGSPYHGGRISVVGSNPIWLARLIGLLGIGCTALVLKRPERLALGGVGIATAFYGMALTGSRGPIIGLALAIAYGAFAYKNKHRAVTVGAVGACLALLFVLGWNLLGSSRFDLSGTAATSTSLRFGMLDHALHVIKIAPEGVGVGKFDYRHLSYPHNIYIEYLVEWGWLIGTAFNAAIVAGSIALLRMRPVYNPLKLLLIYELVNAGFSGDVTSPRFLYGLVMIGNASLLMKWLDARKLRISHGSPTDVSSPIRPSTDPT